MAAVLVGDGATSEGDVHEAMNLAAVWRLGVLFVVENNHWGLSTPVSEQYACADLADRAAGYGMPGRDRRRQRRRGRARCRWPGGRAIAAVAERAIVPKNVGSRSCEGVGTPTTCPANWRTLMPGAADRRLNPSASRVDASEALL